VKYSSSKELNQLIKRLLKKGWKYERRKKHAMLISPDNSGRICIATSPSGSRVRNYVESMTKKYCR
jgi:predicted RNA binding protein YcfA (HicA-like mRNA interferase family)